MTVGLLKSPIAPARDEDDDGCSGDPLTVEQAQYNREAQAKIIEVARHAAGDKRRAAEEADFRRVYQEVFGHKPAEFGDVDAYRSRREFRGWPGVAVYVASVKAERDEARRLDDRDREQARQDKLDAAETGAAARVDRAAAARAEADAEVAQTLARLTVDDGDDDDGCDALPALIPGLLPASKIVLLVAPKSHGKSIVATAIGLCVASGRDWVDGTPVEARRVLNCSLEMDRHGSRLFRNRIARGLGIPASAYKDRLLQYQNADDSESTPVVRFDRPDSLQAFRDTIGMLPSLDLIVIDSLSELTHDDLNSNSHMGPLMAELRRIRDDFGVSILLLAHSSEPGEIVRGARVVTEKADLEYRLVRANPNAFDSVMTLTRKKVRIGVDVRECVQLRAPDGPDKAIALEVVGDKPASRAKPKLDDRTTEVIAVIVKHGPIGVNAIMDHVDFGKSTIYRVLGEAGEAGLIEKDSSEKWVAVGGGAA